MHLLFNLHISFCVTMLMIQIVDSCNYHSYTCFLCATDSLLHQLYPQLCSHYLLPQPPAPALLPSHSIATLYRTSSCDAFCAHIGLHVGKFHPPASTPPPPPSLSSTSQPPTPLSFPTSSVTSLTPPPSICLAPSSPSSPPLPH